MLISLTSSVSSHCLLPFLLCSMTSVIVRTGITMPELLLTSKQPQTFREDYTIKGRRTNWRFFHLLYLYFSWSCTHRLKYSNFFVCSYHHIQKTPNPSLFFTLSVFNLFGVLKSILWHLKWDSVSLAAWGEGIAHLSSAVTQARLGRIMVSFNSRGLGSEPEQMGDGPISPISTCRISTQLDKATVSVPFRLPCPGNCMYFFKKWHRHAGTDRHAHTPTKTFIGCIIFIQSQKHCTTQVQTHFCTLLK